MRTFVSGTAEHIIVIQRGVYSGIRGTEDVFHKRYNFTLKDIQSLELGNVEKGVDRNKG